MMFLLIITFWLNGQQGVDVTRFNTEQECYSALQAVYQSVPNLNAVCKAVPRMTTTVPEAPQYEEDMQ